MTIGAGFVAAVCVVVTAQDQSDAAFAQAVARYVEIHRSAAVGLNPPTEPEAADTRATTLARRIVAQRPSARPGDVFGPAAPRFREIIKTEINGPQGKGVRAAIAETNTVVAVKVNERYPTSLPRTTMPGQLLAKLPVLPPELEYRFLGRSLLLIDWQARLVVDVLADALSVRSR